MLFFSVPLIEGIYLFYLFILYLLFSFRSLSCLTFIYMKISFAVYLSHCSLWTHANTAYEMQKSSFLCKLYFPFTIFLVVLYIFLHDSIRFPAYEIVFLMWVLHFCSLLSGHIYALFFKGISCFYFLYCTRAKYLHCEEFLVMFSFLQDFKGTVSKDWEFVSEGLKIDSLLLECAQIFCYNFISFLPAGSSELFYWTH